MKQRRNGAPIKDRLQTTERFFAAFVTIVLGAILVLVIVAIVMAF